MPTIVRSHRLVAGLAAAVALLVAAACAGPTAPLAPSTDAVVAAVKGEPDLGPDLAAVRAATARFQNVENAIAAGYANPAFGTCDQIAIGTMGIHVGNPALLADPAIDPEKPEVLLYLPTGDGFRLIAVEWVKLYGPTPPPAGTPAPTLFGQTFQGPMPGHVPGMPWHWDLHAWVWANNPSGMFEQWNPSISCP